MDVSGWIQTKFRSAEFGDKRLTDRLVQLGDELGSSPAESIPAACGDWASTKATYRFCDNESVDPNEVLSAHKQQQQSRVSRSDELLIVSDTTELVFPRHPSKEGLGDIDNSEMDFEGIKLHSTIGINPRTHRMTGIINQQPLIEDHQVDEKYDANSRAEPIQLDSEHEKWSRSVDSVAFYEEVTGEMESAGFIIRANQNRRI